MPLVLVHNDVVANPAHAWDDKEGVHYHYPSKYQGMVQAGERFVYYRGVHRAGGKRGPAEYVGAGRIGPIWKDPDRPRAWYCGVVDYQRFPTAVPAKVNGTNREDIRPNLWRDGVRDLDPAVYAQIIAEGAAGPAQAALTSTPDTVAIAGVDNLIVPPKLATHQTARTDLRRSKRSKAIGDWAEWVALRYLRETLPECSHHVHRAALGETPGWDIDYRDASGALQRVEVKGTIAAAFTGVELTAGEMRAARAHGPAYWLCLVAGCETAAPKVQLVQDPAARLDAGEWTAKPTVFSVKFAEAG